MDEHGQNDFNFMYTTLTKKISPMQCLSFVFVKEVMSLPKVIGIKKKMNTPKEKKD